MSNHKSTRLPARLEQRRMSNHCQSRDPVNLQIQQPMADTDRKRVRRRPNLDEYWALFLQLHVYRLGWNHVVTPRNFGSTCLPLTTLGRYRRQTGRRHVYQSGWISAARLNT